MGQTSRTFDRVPQFDEQSRQYPIRTLVKEKDIRSYTWRCQKNLDQGNEGACVGFGWAHNLIARPKEHLDVDNTYARALYKAAQTRDEWPGENYEGTSVLGGAKALQDTGLIKEYRWAFGLQEVLLALSYAGPVVLGLNWKEGMFEPDIKGFIAPTGSLLGGHCLLARGINVKGQYVILRNSWGPDWGINGDCRVKFTDLDLLLKDEGEACIPIGETR